MDSSSRAHVSCMHSPELTTYCNNCAVVAVADAKAASTNTLIDQGSNRGMNNVKQDNLYLPSTGPMRMLQSVQLSIETLADTSRRYKLHFCRVKDFSALLL